MSASRIEESSSPPDLERIHFPTAFSIPNTFHTLLGVNTAETAKRFHA